LRRYLEERRKQLEGNLGGGDGDLNERTKKGDSYGDLLHFGGKGVLRKRAPWKFGKKGGIR